MTARIYFYLCLGCLCAGIIWFCWLNSIIIFYWPGRSQIKSNPSTHLIEKKRIKLYFWLKEKWHVEETDIIWTSHAMQENLLLLINAWLKLMHDEALIEKQVNVQSVILADQTAFISCDRNFLDKPKSTYQKLICIESLLKTISTQNLGIKNIALLVDHKPLHDYHIDFSSPWPIEGFMHSA